MNPSSRPPTEFVTIETAVAQESRSEGREPCPEQCEPRPEEREPCPIPLSWQQVLQTFRAESRPWEVDRGEYVLRGRTFGEGEPLYFLNGLGGTSELFALAIWLLKEDFRCVVYDYPSLPARGKRWRSLAIDDFVTDLFAAADLLGDERFELYATSFGSAVAFSAMLAEPGRINRAVIQGGFAHRRLTIFERLLIRLIRRSRRPLGSIPLRGEIQQQNHRQWFPPYDFGRWQFFLDNTGQVPVSALAQRAAMLQSLDLRGRLGEIRQPVLLVRSEGEGQVSAKSVDELQVGLAGCESETLHTCGHLPYLTHPHRLVKLLRSFLQPERDAVVESVSTP